MSSDKAQAPDSSIRPEAEEFLRLIVVITKSRNDVRDSQDDLRKLTEEPVSRHACRVSADTTTNAPAAEAVLKTGLDCLADAHSLKTLVSTLETKTDGNKTDDRSRHSSTANIVEFLTGAANANEQMTSRNELLHLLYDYCRREVEGLGTKLTECTVELQEDEALHSSPAWSSPEVQRQCQTTGSAGDTPPRQCPRCLSTADDPFSSSSDDSSGDTTTIDPVLLKRKMKELRRKTAFCNERWIRISQELIKEIEEAKCKLAESFTSRTLACEEQRETHIEDLKKELLDLEKQQEFKHEQEVEKQMMTPGDDAQLAMACQLEEYAKKNAHLEDALSRERSRKASLEQQWKSLMEQLQNAREEKAAEQRNNNILKKLLQRVHCDTDVVETYLKVNSPPSMQSNPVKSTTQSPRLEQQSEERERKYKLQTPSFKRRGTLEEDGPRFRESCSILGSWVNLTALVSTKSR